MNSIMFRQIVVVAALSAILCIAFLTEMLLMLGNIKGVQTSQTGIMLIAPSYIAPSHQFVDLKVTVSTEL